MTTDEAEVPAPRLIVIAGEIDWETVGRVAETLSLMEAVSDDPVRVKITSPGGSVECGLAIHDLLICSPSFITTEAYGTASSIAAIIMQAGDTRLIAPNALMKIHDIRVELSGTLDLSDFKSFHEEMYKTNNRMVRMLARRTGQKVSQIRKWCHEEREFSAREAKRFGFVDALIKPKRT